MDIESGWDFLYIARESFTGTLSLGTNAMVVPSTLVSSFGAKPQINVLPRQNFLHKARERKREKDPANSKRLGLQFFFWKPAKCDMHGRSHNQPLRWCSHFCFLIQCEHSFSHAPALQGKPKFLRSSYGEIVREVAAGCLWQDAPRGSSRGPREAATLYTGWISSDRTERKSTVLV